MPLLQTILLEARRKGSAQSLPYNSAGLKDATAVVDEELALQSEEAVRRPYRLGLPEALILMQNCGSKLVNRPGRVRFPRCDRNRAQ